MENRSRKNIFKRIKIIILTCVIVILLLSLFFKITLLICMSGSMEKEIKTGSICVITKRVGYEDINVGDIVTFTLGKQNVTHRVVEIKDDCCITKGDNNEDVDSFVMTKDNFIGKELFEIPYIGYAAKFIGDNVILCLAVIFVATLAHTIYTSVLKRSRVSREEKS